MKTPGEVIAEGLLASISCKEYSETRRPLLYLRRKCIQINFPNLNEAIIIYFDKNPSNEHGIRYEIYSTPLIRCKKCGWRGTESDLPVNEKSVQIKDMADIQWDQSELMNPKIRKKLQKCPNCGSKRLIKKPYRHRGRDLYIVGTHNDIAKLGTITDSVIPRRIDGVLDAIWSFFVNEKIKLEPLWRFGLAIQFGKLLL